MDDLQSRLNQGLLNRIKEHLPGNVPVYIVGGAIRDALLSRQNADLDFVTAGDGLKIARKVADGLRAAYFPMDTQRKVARIILRDDSQTGEIGEKQTKIDFSTFQGEDLLHDLQGRDFTINAMAVEIHDLGKIIDPLGGAGDLLSKRLRACSDRSLIDDSVRVLRAARFSVNLGLHIQHETLRLIKAAAGKLPEVSTERVRDELFKILLQVHPSTGLRILDQFDALKHVLPEFSELKGVQQTSPHVLDAWDHTLELLTRLEKILEALASEYNPDKTGNLALGLATVQLGRYRTNLAQHFENALNPERPHRGILFMAGLYHDAGKVWTQTTDENGKIRFLEHEIVSSKLVEKRGKALKLSNMEVERLVMIVKNHMRPSMLSHEMSMPSRKAVYRFFRDTGAAGIDICILSLADILATYGPTLPQERWAHHLEVVRELMSAWWEDPEGKILPPIIIGGDELMDELGLPPGPLIGYMLETIREAQVAGEVHTREEAISLAQTLIVDN